MNIELFLALFAQCLGLSTLGAGRCLWLARCWTLFVVGAVLDVDYDKRYWTVIVVGVVMGVQEMVAVRRVNKDGCGSPKAN